MYKVCWCGDGGCTIDEHFSMHVATLIINGMMITVGGDGQTPNRTGDMVETRQQVAALGHMETHRVFGEAEDQ